MLPNPHEQRHLYEQSVYYLHFRPGSLKNKVSRNIHIHKTNSGPIYIETRRCTQLVYALSLLLPYHTHVFTNFDACVVTHQLPPPHLNPASCCIPSSFRKTTFPHLRAVLNPTPHKPPRQPLSLINNQFTMVSPRPFLPPRSSSSANSPPGRQLRPPPQLGRPLLQVKEHPVLLQHDDARLAMGTPQRRRRI